MSEHELGARFGLLSLTGLGPRRASWLSAAGSASEVLAHLRAGRLPPSAGPAPPGVGEATVRTWIREARAFDVEARLATCARLGIELVGPAHRRWPLARDPEPPSLLFASGRLELLGRRPAVAIVGTRRCTTIGRSVARSFGAALADAGVVVVSGLASGIDGEAHAGALGAGTTAAVAVVGSGLDIVYPRANASLWRRVASDGLLLSEAPPGARPERWRFPARNRLIAALADIVVVVESHSAGGSLLTVGEAADRGITVMAVPGAVTNPASAGTNQLLVDGAPPACTVDDILDLLPEPIRPAGLAVPDMPTPDTPTQDGGDELSALARSIRRDLAAGVIHVDELFQAHRAPLPQLLAAVDELERWGLAVLDGSTVVATELDRGRVEEHHNASPITYKR